MANKTIHELTELTQGNVGTSQELAIYDVSDNSTKRVTVGNLFGIDEFLTADDDDEPTGQVDFTSEDDELSPTSTEDVDLLTGNDSWSQRFHKVSQMFKNIRYILGKLGTTDISNIGNGTVTGALSELNSKYVFQYRQSSSITIAANATQTVSISTEKEGYTPKGIVGIYCSNTNVLNVNKYYFNYSTAVVVLMNNYTSSVSTPVRVYILYQKN